MSEATAETVSGREVSAREDLICRVAYLLIRRGTQLDVWGALSGHALDQVVDAVLTAQAEEGSR